MKHKLDIINSKSKASLAIIWAHILFLTWVILKSDIAIMMKVICLLLTMIVVYLQLVLIQKYHILKVRDLQREHKHDE